MTSHVRNAALLVALTVPLSTPVTAHAQAFDHQFGEVRQYHDHWLRVCPQKDMRSCRAVTYLKTDDSKFFLLGRMSVERASDGGTYTIRFLDESITSVPNGLDTPVYQFAFSNGEKVAVTMRTNRTYSERFVDDQAVVTRLLALMKSENRVTISGPDAAGAVGVVPAQSYSLIGLTSALAAIEGAAETVKQKANFIKDLPLPGSDWYAADGWPGEYPIGFTVKASHSRLVRSMPTDGAPKNVACAFKAGATYHVWNTKRVSTDDVRFVSLQETSMWKVDRPTFVYYTDKEERSQKVIIRSGETWRSLRYFAEGLHQIQFDGKLYEADQVLFSTSTQISGSKTPKLQQWLGRSCDEGKSGWLRVQDMSEDARFGAASIPAYGKAFDE